MKPTDAETIPEFCLLVRESYGLSTRDFADKIGVSFTSVSKVERGLVDYPVHYLKTLKPFLRKNEWEYAKELFWREDS